jgi:uncharacterized protein YfaS (alpha-2-macroglobulin family)
MSIKKALLVLLSFLVITACDQKTEKEQLQEQQNELYKFREHINQVSDHVISTREAIIIKLTEPVEGWVAGKELDASWVTLEPYTAGKLTVVDSKTISFLPDQALKQDTKYKVKFQLAQVKKVPKDLALFTFICTTIAQDFIVSVDPVGSYTRDYQYINGSIRSSDIMESKNAQKIITAQLNGKELDISFLDTNDLGKYFEFKIDSIPRPLEDEQVKISWDGSSINVAQKGDNTVTLPGKSNFTVTNVELVNEESAYILINFSDPLKSGQNLDGLIQIEGVDQMKIETTGNEVRIYPSKSVTGSKKVEVFTGITSTDGYKLKKEFSSLIAFEQVAPEVKLVRSGTILPSSQNSKINFKAVNLNAVDVMVYKVYSNNVLQFLQNENLNSTSSLRDVGRPIARKVVDLKGTGNDVNKWNTYSVNLSKIIAADPGAIYRVEFKYQLAYSAYKCDYTVENAIVAEEIDFDDSFETSNWDTAQNYYYDDYDDYYDYNWRDRDDPCTTSFYRNKSVTTNVLASDLGITVKRGENNSYFIAVNNLITTKPLGGAQVTFYNYQQQEIARSRTDSNGLLTMNLDRTAFFAKVIYNDMHGYVRLDDGNALSTSKFDTAGKKLQKGIKGYIYGERGVWRPGDHLYLTFMLDDSDNALPSGHPIQLELRDPNGKITHKEVQKNGLNNFYQFDLLTDNNAPTGNWNAKVEVGGVTFNKTIKIENIKPNRLKVTLDFNEEIIKSGQDVKGALNAMWLHGAIAKGLKANVTAKYYATPTVFKKYDSYVFDDPSRFFDLQESQVFDGKLDQNGDASFNFKPTMNTEAPGMLKASFLTKVYENGGDFSTNVSTKTYSPYNTYVGIDVPPGDKQRGMLLTDTDHKFDVVTVNQNGTPKATAGLEVKVYKVNWRWWWQSQAGSLSKYEAREYKQEVYSTTINTAANGKGNFTFSLNYPEWGRYLVRVYDPKSDHATGKIIYVDWPGWAGKSRKVDPEMASMLIFNADKETYQVGENATINFPSTTGGRALVTVENGTEVLDAQWVETKDKQTQVTLPLKTDYVPNVYVHITYVQPHAQTVNDLPLRMYGVIPLLVENKDSHLEPQISMPKELAPKTSAKITVSEKNGNAMTYTLAVVDEGLLNLTNFKTPDAWDTFFAREALGVKSWDIYDDVIGAYGGRIDAAFAIGGDGSVAASKAKKANRFEPMVIHLGPFALKAGEKKTHTIDIPQYVGSVRTMVVAGNNRKEAYGSAQETTPVKKAIMMLASLPRKLSTGETVRLPVTVFAMDDKVKDVKITLESSPYFDLLNGNSQQLKFTKTGDQIAYFDVKVKGGTGIAKLSLTARGNGETAAYQTEIDVVNPNPYSTVSEKAILKPGETATIAIKPFGTKGSNAATATFSSLPAMDLGRRLNYLIRYPHGCVEQVTSAAFPQLHLSSVVDLNSNQQKEISNNIKQAINTLGYYQQPDGGFSYWPGSGGANDWGTTYAGHFIIEAQKAGYTVPISFKSNWIAYQQRVAKKWRYNDRNDLFQAYRLYTLAVAGAPDLSSMNRLRESENLSNDSKLRLAATYALVGQNKAAEELLSKSNIDFQPNNYDYRTYGTPQRNRAMALETYTIMKKVERARQIMEEIAKNLDSDRYYNTQALAYSLIAISKYAAYIGGKGVNISYTFNGNTSNVLSKKSIANRNLDIAENPTNIKITNNGSNTIFFTNAITGKLPVGNEKMIQSKLTATTTYIDKNGAAINVSKIGQGTEIIAVTTVTNTTGSSIEDVALTQILPSGWEIVNTRFTDYGASATNAGVEYTDIKDDRVNYYFDLKAKQSLTFKTVINASYLGKYYLPGTQCEAMYDADYIARNTGQWIEVVRQGN